MTGTSAPRPASISSSSAVATKSAPTGLAQEATIKILSETIKILSNKEQNNGTAKISAGGTTTNACPSTMLPNAKKAKLSANTEPKRPKVLLEKTPREPKQKDESKLARKRDAKILKEKLKIVSNGRGKSKVNKILFETIFSVFHS